MKRILVSSLLAVVFASSFSGGVVMASTAASGGNSGTTAGAGAQVGGATAIKDTSSACVKGNDITATTPYTFTAKELEDPVVQNFEHLRRESATNSAKQPPVLNIKTCTENGVTRKIYSSNLVAASNIQPVNGLFDGGENAICATSEEGIICRSNSTTESKLRLPTCELFEQAVVSRANNDWREKYKTYACTDFIDPLPATYFTTAGSENQQPICIFKFAVEESEWTQSALAWQFGNVSTVAAGTYCNALLTPTGGGFTGFFGIVRLIYDISLPILIALAVISMVGVGVFIMYAPGGGEDVMKKAKTMAIQIATGFLLLLLLRVFLGLISADFFGAEPPAPAPTATQQAKP